MNAIWTVIVGFCVGLVARAVMPGKDAAGVVVTTALGIGGAVVGALLGRIIGILEPASFGGLAMSVLGAVALLAAYRRFSSPMSAQKQ